MSEESYIKLARLILILFENSYDNPEEDRRGILSHQDRAKIMAQVNSISAKNAQELTQKLQQYIVRFEPEIYTLNQYDRAQLDATLRKANDIATMIDGPREAAGQVLQWAFEDGSFDGYWPVFKGERRENQLYEFRHYLFSRYVVFKGIYAREDAENNSNNEHKLERVFSRLKEKFKEMYKIPLDDSEFPQRTSLTGAQHPQLTSRLQLSQHIHALSNAIDKLQLKTY